MNASNIKAISIAVNNSISAREAHKESLSELRRIAVVECGFDQDMVMKSNVVDLLYGYVKGAMYEKGLV